MNTDQAKEILRLFRPWADANDPAFAEALARAREDATLGDWFEKHCAVQMAIRDRLRQNRAPQGLKEQIVSEHAATVRVSWLRQPAVLAVAAMVILLGVLSGYWMTHSPSSDSASLTGFRNRMLKSAARIQYNMDLETGDAEKIRAFLAAQKAVADYQLSEPLQQTPTTGCGVLTWQGHKVSMVCFRTGKPLLPGAKSDLFLFVVAKNAILNVPSEKTPVIQQAGSLAVASWSSGGKVYLLAAEGDEQLLRKFL